MARRISRQTFLGLALEEVVALAMADLEPPVARSPTVPRGAIRPDFLRGGARPALVAVTHTPSRNTFQKKKWRYVHEILAARQLYGPALRAVSVQAAPPGAVQPRDEALLAEIFDATVHPDPSVLRAVESLLEARHTPAGRAAATVRALAEHPAVAALVRALSRALTAALEAPPRHPGLWRLVAGTAPAPLAPARALHTALRPTCFGLVLVPDADLEPTLALLERGARLPPDGLEPLVRAGAPLVPRLGGPVPDPDVFRHTLRHGFPPREVAALVRALREASEGRHVLEDLAHPERARTWAARVLATRGAERFGEACAAAFSRAVATRSRLHHLDYALLAAGLSITEVDRLLAQRHGDLGHANRVQCTISARCPMRRTFTAAETRQVGERVWALLLERTDLASVDEHTATERILAGRRRTLKLLGAEANPVELLVGRVLAGAGLEPRRVSLPCLVGDLGIRGRGSRVERLVEVCDGHRTAWLKVVSGYRGGVEHKAEELAGRGWALRHRRGEGGWRRDERRLVLVYEGRWTDDALAHLARAGWSAAVPAADLVGAAPVAVRTALLGEPGL